MALAAPGEEILDAAGLGKLDGFLGLPDDVAQTAEEKDADSHGNLLILPPGEARCQPWLFCRSEGFGLTGETRVP